MKAILYGLPENGHMRPVLIHIPEAKMVSETNYTMLLFDAKNYPDLSFFQSSPDRKICEFDISFDLVARMYCLMRDYSPFFPLKLKTADTKLWNELVKEQMQIVHKNKKTSSAITIKEDKPTRIYPSSSDSPTPIFDIDGI